MFDTIKKFFKYLTSRTVIINDFLDGKTVEFRYNLSDFKDLKRNYKINQIIDLTIIPMEKQNGVIEVNFGDFSLEFEKDGKEYYAEIETDEKLFFLNKKLKDVSFERGGFEVYLKKK